MSVAVVITSEAEASALVGWAWQCARARGEDMVVLVPAGKDAADDAEPLTRIRAAVSDQADAHARMTATQRESAGADDPSNRKKPDQVETERCPEVVVQQVKGSDSAQVLLAALTEHGIKLLVLAKHAKVPGDQDVLPVRLFREARCMVLLLRLGGESNGDTCRRVLVPTSGGPHATEAIRLADKIVQLPDPSCPVDSIGPPGVDALYVEPDIGPEAESVGKRILDKAIKRASAESAQKTVRPLVEIADDFKAGLAHTVERGKYDLVLIGAANQWHARRALFNMLPEALLSDESTLTVGVVRRALPLMSEAAEKVRQLFSRGIPQLEREDRVSLVERVQSASEWNIDFIALICLSTMIATLGLMLDSVAVVIGAMLVAPLMTPLIGCGLAVVQGNGYLLRHASKSVLLGFLVALVIALLMGMIIPHAGVTDQMLARGKPNALDLGVALISGVAAAYATARPNLLGALPGVAIAAALVPPIATAGVALSDGDALTAAGAVMLFATNIVAIVLGAAAALFAVGMQAKHLHAREKRWTRHAVMGLTVGAVILSVPLMYFLYASLPHADVSEDFQDTIAQWIEKMDAGQLKAIQTQGVEDGQMIVEVTLQHHLPTEPLLVEMIDDLIEDYLDQPCRTTVRTELVTQAAP